MFDFNSLKKVQIEITNRCQASCPMCLRNIHGGIENPNLLLSDWTLKQFTSTFDREVLTKIKHINFCGDFGDPIMNSDLAEMCHYAATINPDIEITINTNGSARTPMWWSNLAAALPKKHSVVFAIDGLSTTHSLYRIGTDYNMILRNATSFIEAGGKAEWMFIRFKHNEHEVETARALASTLKFERFNTKDSKRFGKQYPVLDKQGNISYYLEPPTTSKVKAVELVDLKDYKQWVNEIDCFTLNDKELYIDANGYLMPCCLIGSFLYANYDVALYEKYKVIDSTSVTSIARELQLEVFSIIRDLGGLDALDSKMHSIKDIMSTDSWQTLMQTKWANFSASPCKILCSKSSPYISIDEQINRAS